MENNNLEILRHSLSHIMACAVKEIWPQTKFTIGPAIENGFYYDFDFGNNKIIEADLAKIEKKMNHIIKQNLEFKKSEMDIGKAISQEKKSGQIYKVELLKDLEKEFSAAKNPAGKSKGKNDYKVSYYQLGNFIDLCRGPHIKTSGKIKKGSFKLSKLAGAYWRGNEKNKMLTRIYGVGFNTKEELDSYLHMAAEAERRDHKKLGTKLELFAFHKTAPGMPYWLPKGLIICNELVNFWRQEHSAGGYQEIASPLVNKKELWEISGHWEHYQKDMFIANMGENEIYGIKPMNCPNAMVVYKLKTRSYRDLPIRFSDTDYLHRYELSGTLNGLFRVRSFRQDDSHNFIAEDQIEEEYLRIFAIVDKFYGIFNLSYKFRLGTRPEKYMGDKKTWDKAEAVLHRILIKTKGKNGYLIAEGDGAFYGPKVDIIMKDILNRDWQMGTIQLDFQIPRRFGLTFTDKDGQEKIPIVIHRVIYGSLERFIGILIEHFAGVFPLWLSPVQVKIISVGERHISYCHKVASELIANNIRVEVDDNNETVGNKIRKAANEKAPYTLVIGDKEAGSDKLSVRDRGSRETREIGKDDFINEVKLKIIKKIVN